MHCSRHKFRQIPIIITRRWAFDLIRAVLAWSKLLLLLATQPVISNAARTHTQRQSCTLEGRRRSPTRHLCNRQLDDDRSLALYKMTTQVVKCCINYSTARRFRLQDQWPGWWLSVKHCSFHIFCNPCRISLASDPPPSHPCQWSDSDHTGKSYVLGRHRESWLRPANLRLSIWECDFPAINIPSCQWRQLPINAGHP